jgi:hypothetical protein
LLYTHYYGAGTLLALGIYWLITRRSYSPLVLTRLAVIVLALAVLYFPWVEALRSDGTLNLGKRIPEVSSAPANLSAAIGALNRFNNGKFDSMEGHTSAIQALLGIAIFTLPAVMAIWYGSRRGPQGALLGWLLAGIPVAMAIIIGKFAGLNYRHFCFAAPGYYLAVAMGWSRIPSFRARSIWLAVAFGFSILALRANLVATKPDYRTAFLPFVERYRPGDCVAGRPQRWDNRPHFAWEVYYRNRAELRTIPFDALPVSHMQCERLWIVWDQTWWMNSDAAATNEALAAIAGLGEHYTLISDFKHPAVHIREFERSSE